MNRLASLYTKHASLLKEAKTISAAAAAEDRDLTEAEQARYDAILGARGESGERTGGALAAVAADLADEKRIQEYERTMTPGVDAVADRPRTPMGAANITGVQDLAANRPWSSFGEQMIAIARASMPGATVDPRLFAATPTGASASENSAGGFLIHSDYSEALLDRAREESPILGMCRSIPVGDGIDSIDLPVIDETSRATGSRWGGVQVYRRAEAQAVTATKPTFGQLKLEPTEIMGLAYATDRLLRNAPTVEAIFGNAFASEFAFKVTDEIVRGTGGALCLGILNAPATVSQAIETGQTLAGNPIITKNISNMWMHVPPRSKARGVWVANAECGPWLDELSIPAGTAALEPRFVTYDQNGALRIKGRPVIELEQCSALGTVGDFMFVDFGEYLLAPKGQIEGQSSMHVQFIYNEMTFRWTYYINGRPAWLSSVSAYKGSASKSPFVTLAVRT
jgi:HK97 family phage major capsid protein